MARRSGVRGERFTISVVSEMLEIHPQTLRMYEREGLIEPSRSQGKTRLYSRGDIERLEVILTLTRELGINLAGVEVILELREKLIKANNRVSELEELLRSDALEQLRTHMETAKAEEGALVPAFGAKLIRLKRRSK